MKDYHTFTLAPRDVLFMRDARPMEASDAGLGANWPRPDHLYAALHHSFLAQWPAMQEWEGAEHRKTEDEKQRETSCRFGGLKIIGPFPCKNGEMFLPCPLDLNMKLVACEDTNLPHPLTFGFVPKTQGKTDYPKWLSVAEYGAYLAGDTVAPESRDIDLFGADRSFGIAMDPDTGTTKEGRLYQAEYLRLQNGVSMAFAASCVVTPKGRDGAVDVFTKDFPRDIVFGGQQGVAYLREIPDVLNTVNALLSAPAKAVASGDGKYYLRWTLLTPAVFNAGWLPGWVNSEGGVMLPKSRPERIAGESRTAWKARVNATGNIDARLIAACVGKPIAFSGWHATKNAPKPTVLAVPAGSSYVFACSNAAEANALAAALAYPMPRSDRFGEKGFGIGTCSPIHIDIDQPSTTTH